MALLEIRNLVKHFNTNVGTVHAVDDISVSIERGETLGVVGESGCGKSTLGRVVLRLLSATGGHVLFEGEDILEYDADRMKKLRREMQIIFQDPYASLNPRMTVWTLIAESLKINRMCESKRELDDRVREIMKTVGLADRFMDSYPHELDGGRRQRIGIARALVLYPKFVVCDEPVSALDVSIQAQILNLMMDIQQDRGLSYMFVTHDLSVVKHISDNIAVMYMGRLVELSPSDEMFENPAHPYTKALLKAVPTPSLAMRGRKRYIIRGEVASPIDPKPGCRFAPRCERCIDICMEQDPATREIAPGHFAACHHL